MSGKRRGRLLKLFFSEILVSVFIPLLHILHLHQLFPDAAVLYFSYEGGSCSEVQGSICTVCCREKEKPLSKLLFPGSRDGEGRIIQPGLQHREVK